MLLPIFQSSDSIMQMLQNKWSSILNPIISNPLTNAAVLTGIKLTAGTNQVNHLLQKPLTGWFIVRQRAQASIYDQQDSNPNPQLTLTLVSSAPVTVDIMVY